MKQTEWDQTARNLNKRIHDADVAAKTCETLKGRIEAQRLAKALRATMTAHRTLRPRY